MRKNRLYDESLDSVVYKYKHSYISYFSFIRHLKVNFTSISDVNKIVRELEYFCFSRESIKHILIDWMED